MRAEHAAGDGASLEQAEAEQHGIAHAAPYRADGVAARGNDDSSWEITGLEYVSEMYYPGA